MVPSLKTCSMNWLGTAGHLSGLVPEGPEKALLAAYVSTTLLFAGRKYTQAIKDDIGDKSVFTCAILLTPLLQPASSCTEALSYTCIAFCWLI